MNTISNLTLMKDLMKEELEIIAISFLLMNWCELLDVQPNLLRKLKFKDKILINRIYKAPEVFKITLNEENEIMDIENLEFTDLN